MSQLPSTQPTPNITAGSVIEKYQHLFANRSSGTTTSNNNNSTTLPKTLLVNNKFSTSSTTNTSTLYNSSSTSLYSSRPSTSFIRGNGIKEPIAMSTRPSLSATTSTQRTISSSIPSTSSSSALINNHHLHNNNWSTTKENSHHNLSSSTLSLLNNYKISLGGFKRELSPSSVRKNLDVIPSSVLSDDNHQIHDLTSHHVNTLTSRSQPLAQPQQQQPTQQFDSYLSRSSLYQKPNAVKSITSWKPLSEQERSAITSNLLSNSSNSLNTSITINSNNTTTNSNVNMNMNNTNKSIFDSSDEEEEENDLIASRKRMKMNHFVKPIQSSDNNSSVIMNGSTLLTNSSIPSIPNINNTSITSSLSNNNNNIITNSSSYLVNSNHSNNLNNTFNISNLHNHNNNNTNISLNLNNNLNNNTNISNLHNLNNNLNNNTTITSSKKSALNSSTQSLNSSLSNITATVNSNNHISSGKQFQQIRKNKEELITYQTLFYQIHYIVAMVLESFDKQEERIEQELYSGWCFIQERKKLLHDRRNELFKKESTLKLHELLNYDLNINNINELLNNIEIYFRNYNEIQKELKETLNCIAISDDIEISTPEMNISNGIESGIELAFSLEKSFKILQQILNEMNQVMNDTYYLKLQFTNMDNLIHQSTSELNNLSNQNIPYLSNIESEHTSLLFQSNQTCLSSSNVDPFSFNLLRESLGL